MKPFFSIIIPTRQIGSYLIDETLPALEAQTFRAFDVHIITDESSTSHQKLTKKYSWLRIIHNNIQTKPGEKRDLIAKRTPATILAFIDDDVFPPPDWLKKAHQIIEKKKNIAALGGPGVVPPKVSFWEKVFDSVLRTWIGSGSYTYRFVPMRTQFVDDYPTMNLMIRKDIFIKIGGFDNKHWPGEDSKLLNKLSKVTKEKILYHPDALVYHHRRDSLMGHIKQHMNYGKTRGAFAAEGDTNSTSFMYVIPAIFVLYLVALLFLLLTWGPTWWIQLYSVGVILYGALMIYTFFQSFLMYEDIIIAVLAGIVVPITHITYGLFYIGGYIRKKFQLSDS